MTDFPDKPKRKRTPNRRRKFLLMVALPILALIGGFVALKPQMDTWLATDPFTPQCHFEQDRYFYIWGSYEKTRKDLIVGVNDNISREIVNGAPYAYAWSPDGELFAYAGYGETQAPYIHIINLKTGEDKSIKPSMNFYDVSGVFDWSTDSQVLVIQAYDRFIDTSLLLVDRDLSDFKRYYEFMEILNAIWSPDSQHLFIQQSSAQHDDIVLDIQSGKQQSMLEATDYFGAITWLNTTEILYHTTANQIFVYNIETQVSKLWIDGSIAFDYPSVSSGLTWAIVEHDVNGKVEQVLYNLKEGNKPQLHLEPPFNGAFLKGNTVRSEDDEYLYLYDLDTSNTLTIPQLKMSEPDTHPFWQDLSPSGKFITFDTIVGGMLPGGTGVIDVNTYAELTPFDSTPLTEWIELDGEEWLTYLVATDQQTTVVYLFNPNNNNFCKAQVFNTDFISFQEWQPEPQG